MDTVPEGRPDPRPDPWSATTPTEFLRALQQLRAWAGHPSLRTLTALAGTASVPGRPPANVLPVSTLSDNLAGKRLPNLPRLSFVVAFVGACLRARGHHGEEEIAAEAYRWSQAWQALSAAGPVQPPGQLAQGSSQTLPAPPVADLSSTPARHGLQQRLRWGAARRLPAITGVLGTAVGAVTVWLAMQTAPSNTIEPPLSLPRAAVPGVGNSTPPGANRPPATPPTKHAPAPPADTRRNTPTSGPELRLTTQPQPDPARPAPPGPARPAPPGPAKPAPAPPKPVKPAPPPPNPVRPAPPPPKPVRPAPPPPKPVRPAPAPPNPVKPAPAPPGAANFDPRKIQEELDPRKFQDQYDPRHFKLKFDPQVPTP